MKISFFEKKLISRPLFISVLSFVIHICGYSQNYAFSEIPDSLKLNANCIVRNSITEIELSSVNSGIQRIKKTLTINNKESEHFASLFIQYDINSKVKLRYINIYDASGKFSKTINLSEVQDLAKASQSLFTDDRYKYFAPQSIEYPYSVEYCYEISSKNLLAYQYWLPINNYNLSVEHSELTISYPNDIQISVKENGNFKKSYLEQKSRKIVKWEVNQLSARIAEPYSINFKETVPSVMLMPQVLKYNDFFGVAKDWDSFGKWMYGLYEDRDELKEKDLIMIKSLVSNTNDTLQKIKLLYDYLQKNTRYVNVQLGIGGFQPSSARTVSETGYGDCKALTNYLYAMLKAIGIKSFPALVSSGNYIEPILKDFPNFYQFDHVILCLPLSGDTLWLECTSQINPFGFLGDFTDDRDVLLITNSGGKFAHTKKYLEKDNIRSCKASFKIDSNGTAMCKINTLHKGLQYDAAMYSLILSNAELKKRISETSKLPSINVMNAKVTNYTGDEPSLLLEENLVSKNYGSFSGKYLLLPLNLVNMETSIENTGTKRISDININRSFSKFDTIDFKIPSNYKLENLPKNLTMNTKFGEYSFSVVPTDSGFIYIRKYILHQGRYHNKDYEEFYNFTLAVSKADKTKLMLSTK